MFHKVYFGEKTHYLGPFRIAILMILTKIQCFLIDMYFLDSNPRAFKWFSIVSGWHFNIYFNTNIKAMGLLYQNNDISEIGEKTYDLLKKRTDAMITYRCKKLRIVHYGVHKMFIKAGLDMRFGFYRTSDMVKRSLREKQYAK